MSKYTTELRFICEAYAGRKHSAPYSDIDNIIEDALPHIFDFSFPTYEGLDVKRLEKAIVLAYYTREIGFESVGLFKLKLMQKMRYIMPYYNQLYATMDLKYNPLYDVDYTTTTTGSNEGERTTTNNTINTETHDLKDQHTGSVKDANDGTISVTNTGTVSDSGNGGAHNARQFSNTPQGGLAGISSGTYLTEAEITDSTTNTTNTRTDNTTETTSKNDSVTRTYGDNISHTGTKKNEGSDTMSLQEKFVNSDAVIVKGKRNGQSYMSMIKEYRENIINIDAMIVEECEDLFMRLW